MDNLQSTYPTDPARTAIAIAYQNAAYVADRVFPRHTVARKTYKYTEYPLEESFTVPDTRVGRRSATPMVHFTAAEKSGLCEDYGLQDAIPDDDIRNRPPNVTDPRDRSTMMLTDLLMIAREQRAANLAFDAATYPTTNKVTLAGNDQWSADHADSNPVADILAASDGMLLQPNRLLLGSAVWLKLRTHKTILKSINRNTGDTGIATKGQVEDLFEMEIVIGQARLNTARPGKVPSLARVWGKHALLYHASPNAATDGMPTFGITASYRGREVMTGFDAKIGARGSHGIRVVDSTEEKVIAPAAGYLFKNAVA